MDMSDTPSTTPQTSSESSTSNTQGEDLDAGSECGWRNNADEPRPMFYMGDEDATRYPSSGFSRNIEGQRIKVGICAMSKKTKSKPMKEILGRLGRFEHLHIIVFEEEMICNAPAEDWPVVDALVSFFSTGFPLHKAIQYKNLHKPFVVNDLEAQYALKDRREVYKILVREGIAHPRYVVMNRDEDEKGEFEESEDAIDVNHMTFQRPFVEKPVNAEDHNIYIYFPVSAGGGCQRLFRKVGSRSSVYCPTSRVRKSGSFIYEDFMPTDGTDVKVYTVGPDYAHAEARKSPALDGKVERDKDGKEIRYPVILSAAEKVTARKVCMAFKQNVCGFDLLRTGGRSFVCDVNGFSFVKNSTKYYDDCANVLGTMIVRALAPQLHIPLVLGAAPEDIPVVPTTSGSMMELRCVIAVIRHGDRTPKQKMKMEVKHRRFFELFKKYNGYRKGHLKFKKPKQLQEVLDIARELLDESHHDANPEVLEKKAKLQQLKLVLEMYGHFSGINRKVQMKYQPYGAPKQSSSEEGLNSESNIKYSLHSYEHPKEPSLVLIVKWGGELTPAGKYQAEDLGKAFRTLYPGGQGEFETPGLGFLRLHSTFRHDLKIYASDEGRVQMTAAAFTKGLLALEGELPPILVSMVKSANTNGLLDNEGESSKYQHVVKARIMDILNKDQDFTQDEYDKLVPTKSMSQINAMLFIKNPRRMCDRVYEMVQEITAKVRTLKLELMSRDLKLYHGESWELLIRRWGKLEKDFKLKTGDYDISKIPDIYDCIKYDLQHNQKTLQFARAEELFACSKALADIVIPQEYGITVEEKLHISQSVCSPLMRKIHSDLTQACQGIDEESTRLNSKYSKGVSSPERFVRTRLYFTSESHIHSLLNMLRFGGFCDEGKDEQWRKAMDFLSTTAELNYMTQINIMMFEDPSKEATSPERFHIELHFSPGAYTSCDKTVMNPSSSGYRTSFFTRQIKKSLDNAESDTTKAENKIKEAIKEESLTDEITPPEHEEFAVFLNDCTTNILKQDSAKDLEATDSVSEKSKADKQDKPDDVCSPDGTKETDDLIEEKVKEKVDDTEATARVSDEQCESTVRVSDEQGESTARVSDEQCESTARVSDEQCESTARVSDEQCESTVSDDQQASDSSEANKDTADKTVKSDELTASGNEKSDTSKEDEDVFGSEVSDKLGEVTSEEKTSDDEQSKTLTEVSVQDSKQVPGPHSPDPDIPEWDWGETDKPRSQSETTLTCSVGDEPIEKQPSSATDVSLSPTSTSRPIFISPVLPKGRDRKGSFDSIQSFEEKRSRSLEDDFKDSAAIRTWAMMDHHYRTIHLPINKDFHHSVSSLLYLNPDAFKAFDGFNLVPSLKPLETLHNTLTLRDMDAFLSRATTTKFFTPVSSPMIGATPLPSPKCPELAKARCTSGPSLPSSSNSSAGPSSPTSASTPVDFLNKLKLYIIDKTKQDSTDNDTEVDSTVFSPSVEAKAPSTPGETTLTSPSVPSAFRLVSRSSSNQRTSQFTVTQVVENVPPVDKPETGLADSDKKAKSKDTADNDKPAKAKETVESDEIDKANDTIEKDEQTS